MSMNEKVITSLTILITGFVVVFSVLLLLIGLIKLYGIIVTKAIESSEKKKSQQITKIKKSENLFDNSEKFEEISTVDENGLNDEVIAVISAAVYAMYGEGTVKVKSIKRVPQSRPVWSTAGILENTRPF